MTAYRIDWQPKPACLANNAAAALFGHTKIGTRLPAKLASSSWVLSWTPGKDLGLETELERASKSQSETEIERAGWP